MSPGHEMARMLPTTGWVASLDIRQGRSQIKVISCLVIRNRIYYSLYWSFTLRLYPILIIVSVHLRARVASVLATVFKVDITTVRTVMNINVLILTAMMATPIIDRD